MSGWTPISPWKIQPGTGQVVTAGAAGNQAFTNPVGKQTDAIAIRLAPAATPYLATVTTSGAAGTASTDYPIASTDPPQIIGVGRGQSVNVYFGAAGSAVMCELTH
jgi:hypothetical protein